MDNCIPETKKRFALPHLTKNGKTLLCCFAVPFLAMILIYCCMQVWPVGKNSVLVLDLNAQYIYYFEQFRDIITGGESILYSFERALGGEFMGIFAYYLSSPFSLITALFPKEMITEAMYLILVLKCGCTGLSFGYLLNKTRGDRLSPVYQVMFSTMYALSGFAVVMQHNVMWTDNLIAFPLILIAVDALICQWKYKLYVAVLAYSVLSNFYIGYMTCIFVFIWFFIRYFTLSKEERNPDGMKLHFLRTLSQIAWWSVLAILISGIIILPIYYSLSFGKLGFSTPDFTPEQLFDFADILSKAYFGSYDTVRPEGMPFIYCGTLALIIAPLYFFTDSIPTRRKVGFAAIMLVLIASFNFSTLDIIWHGMQRPNWLNARFAYMFVGLELLMAADAMIHLKEIGKRAVMASSVGWCAMLLVLDAVEATALSDFMTVWPSLLLFTVLTAILPSCIRHMHDKNVCRYASIGLCAVVVTEAVLSSVIALYRFDDDVSYSSRASYREFVDEYTDALAIVEEQGDEDFYRMEKLVHRKKNDNFALDINGLSNSTSTLNARAVDLLEQFGFSSMSHWSMYSGATPVTDALFGIRYLIADESDKRGVPDYIHDLYTLLDSTDEHLDVYENPYSLSIAYSVDRDVLEYDAPPAPDSDVIDDYRDPFTYMNKLLSAMVDEKVEVWSRVDVKESTDQGVRAFFVENHRGYEDEGELTAQLSWVLNIESDMPVYCYFPSDYPREATMKLDGKIIGTHFEGQDFAIHELGSFEPDSEVKFGLYLEESKLYIKTGCSYFWYFDEEAFKSVMEKLSDGVMTVYSETDDVLTGHVNVPAGDEILFTTIPYDEGWEVTVDGKKAETVPVLNETLLAVIIKDGQHEVEFRYRPECVKQGLTLTVIGIAAYAFFCITDWRDERKKKKAALTVPDAELPEAEAFEAAAEDAGIPPETTEDNEND
ncbi:MAG: YfhO family protein [Clostridia bacterium]|nr:YfhO family protein [Clostridia bacterium]